MRWTWRLCLALLPLLGATVAVLCGLELAGVVARGALIGDAGDAERWAAVGFGLLVLPFGLSALRHARLSIDDRALRHLGFGFVCTTREIAFVEVQRWGHAVVSNRGRRERILRFELRGGGAPTVKLSMYACGAQVLALLEQRLGPPAASTATVTGVRFDQPS